jgi:hypothetical protein
MPDRYMVTPRLSMLVLSSISSMVQAIISVLVSKSTFSIIFWAKFLVTSVSLFRKIMMSVGLSFGIINSQNAL